MTDPTRNIAPETTQTEPGPAGDPGPASAAPFDWAATRLEPSPESAPVVPVGRRGGGLRWGIALGLVAVLIAVTAAAAFLLTGSGAPSTIARWAPANSVVYVEARFDLPGDQERQLAEFLSRFPGFDDQAALDTKIGEVLDRVLGAATDGRHDWQTDVAPWFGGEVGVVLTDLGSVIDPLSGLGGAGGSPEFPGLVLATAHDTALAEAWLGSLADGTETERHGGATLHLVAGVQPGLAWAVHEGVAFVGPAAIVRSAINTGGTGGLASNPTFVDARASLAGDHLGLAYVDFKAYVTSLRDLIVDLGDLGDLGGLGGLDPGDLLDQIPPWGIFAIRATGDGLAFEAIAPVVPGPSTDVAARSALLELAPPTTIALLEARAVGAGIRGYLDDLRDQGLDEIIDEIEGGLALLGGPEAAFDWIGAAGVIVTADGPEVSGALVIHPTDADAARQFGATVQGFLALGGTELGLEIRRETYAGETITILGLGDLGGAFGAPVDAGDVSIAYVVADDVVAIGYGPDVIRAILDARAGASLADDPQASALIERAGAEATASAWFDLGAMRELFERLAADAGEDLTEYEREIQPYLLPFDGLAIAMTSDGDLNRSSTILTVH